MMTTSPLITAPLSDESFAQLIANKAKAGATMLVVANGYTARLATLEPGGSWTDAGRGDFGLKAGEAAKAVAATGRLQWLDVTTSPASVDLASAVGTPATKQAITAWINTAESLTSSSGRGDMPKNDELQYLGYLAGWRCQFAGCGKDLKRDSTSGAKGTFSYFAHIIASSPKGPRGDRLLSGQRTDDVENVMLLCDECHRRIDRVDPDRFTVDVLRKMRQDSINEVRRLLDTLRYPEALPLVIMGNITAQSPRFNQREAEEAMWTRQLRMSPQGPEHYFYTGGHIHDPHAPHYWGSVFESLRDDIPRLRKLLNGTLRGDGTKMPLAVFPLHGTSLLVLAGRVVGESSSLTLFQFHRDKPSNLPGGKWAFYESATPPASDKYCTNELRPLVEGEKEACLLVSLTYKIDPKRLPDRLHLSSGFAMGALEVTASSSSQLGPDILAHPLDLDYFATEVEQAIRKLQDQWRVEKVHLVIGAPASACFRLGQKLQARHHANVVCYEALPGNGAQFKETIQIASSNVQELQTGQQIALL